MLILQDGIDGCTGTCTVGVLDKYLEECMHGKLGKRIGGGRHHSAVIIMKEASGKIRRIFLL